MIRSCELKSICVGTLHQISLVLHFPLFFLQPPFTCICLQVVMPPGGFVRLGSQQVASGRGDPTSRGGGAASIIFQPVTLNEVTSAQCPRRSQTWGVPCRRPWRPSCSRPAMAFINELLPDCGGPRRRVGPDCILPKAPESITFQGKKKSGRGSLDGNSLEARPASLSLEM